ncbi:CsbD family protein [Paenibacillus sp. EC2-1]|uniref:CsbD family protein n=1 Tax=Paenibacillus sp. EC2-1 TaxID=3388665 RepID=UPI003BEF498D
MSNHNGLGDKIKGGVSKAKGEVKDQVGNATNNKSMQAEGKVDKAKGEVQQKVGEVKDKH